SLVPNSGRSFSTVDPGIFRSNWESVKAAGEADFLKNWLVLGPFPSDEPGRVSLSQRTAFDEDFARSGDGWINAKASFRAGGEPITWAPAVARRQGFVRLDKIFGPAEWCIAYGYAEFESPEVR